MRQILLWFVVSSLGGLLLGAWKRRPRPGFWLGLFFGPLGWYLILKLPRPAWKCPGCAKYLEIGAKSCRPCGRLFLDVSYRVHEGGPAPK